MEPEGAHPDRPVDWRRLHALGLPAGSIRALLAVLIFGTMWGMLLVRPAQDVPDYLADLLFIIMGHYFAARRRLEPADDPGPPPLYLPRGSVRFVLVAGSAAVAVLLYRRGRLVPFEKNQGAVTLLLVGGFLLGVVLSAVMSWWTRRGHRTNRALEDVRAVISITAGVLLAALVWNRLYPLVAPERVDASLARWIHLGRYGPEHLLAAVIGFYFGSRS